MDVKEDGLGLGEEVRINYEIPSGGNVIDAANAVSPAQIIDQHGARWADSILQTRCYPAVPSNIKVYHLQ